MTEVLAGCHGAAGRYTSPHEGPMIACPACKRLVRPLEIGCPFCLATLPKLAPRGSGHQRRSRAALLAAVASTAVACGGTLTPAPDASTPEDGGDGDATADGPVVFDAGKDAITVKDAFIADDGFCCPLYGGSPKP